MLKKKPIQVYYTSIAKAWQRSSRDQSVLLNTKISSSSPPPNTTTTATAAVAANRCPQFPKPRLADNPCVFAASHNNPCLDLFHKVRNAEPKNKNPIYSQEYLKQLLPSAWSHDPLTTLKLIANLRQHHIIGPGKSDMTGFHTAAYWLYRNHPRTLACNLANFATLGILRDVVEILYRAVKGEDARAKYTHFRLFPLCRETNKRFPGRTCSQGRREAIHAMANQHLEKYRLDPNYRILHDGISDLFARCLNHDIQNLSETITCLETEIEKEVELTRAAEDLPRIGSTLDRTTLLCRSIAQKFFPDQDRGQHPSAERRLSKEVLVPLGDALDPASSWKAEADPNRLVYECDYRRNVDPDRLVKNYLEEVKAGGLSKINPAALLPTEIMDYLLTDDDTDDQLEAAAELQWKTMVEEMFLQRGGFKNCLALDLDVTGCAGALVHLAAQLCEHPCWKGKMLDSDEQGLSLLPIQGARLKSQCEFVRRSLKWQIRRPALIDHVREVFDLILRVAVAESLQPEQMINKVFVFPRSIFNSDYTGFLDEEALWDWESEYGSIHSKFKDEGYGDVVPEIVIWRSRNPPWCAPPQPGLTVLGGYVADKNFLRSILFDNGGDIDPHKVMQAVISGQEYADFVLVD